MKRRVGLAIGLAAFFSQQALGDFRDRQNFMDTLFQILRLQPAPGNTCNLDEKTMKDLLSDRFIQKQTIQFDRDLVNQCVSNLKIGESQVVDKIEQEDQCYAGQTMYKISRKRDGLHVELALHFDFDPAVVDIPSKLKLIQACASQVEDFWARYGIHLHLDISSGTQDPASRSNTPYTTIRLTEKFDRSDEIHYYLLGSPGEFKRAKRNKAFCRLMLHETGHFLGLPDEYPDKNCPNRKTVHQEQNPGSPMYDPDLPFDLLEFSPRHIVSVLSPLCNLQKTGAYYESVLQYYRVQRQFALLDRTRRHKSSSNGKHRSMRPTPAASTTPHAP